MELLSLILMILFFIVFIIGFIFAAGFILICGLLAIAIPIAVIWALVDLAKPQSKVKVYLHKVFN